MVFLAYKIALVDINTLHLAKPHLQSIVYRTGQASRIDPSCANFLAPVVSILAHCDDKGAAFV
jgi:hypothetical protein